MGELSGERIVGAGGSKRKAPELLVLYRCDMCGHGGVVDAYQGPPSCLGGGPYGAHRGIDMDPIRIARGYGDTNADA